VIDTVVIFSWGEIHVLFCVVLCGAAIIMWVIVWRDVLSQVLLSEESEEDGAALEERLLLPSAPSPATLSFCTSMATAAAALLSRQAEGTGTSLCKRGLVYVSYGADLRHLTL
jgi:hypothetical protein